MIHDNKHSSHSSKSFEKTLGSQEHVVEGEETSDCRNTQLVDSKHSSLNDGYNMSSYGRDLHERNTPMSHHKYKEAIKKNKKINGSPSIVYSPRKPFPFNSPNNYQLTMDLSPCYAPIINQQRDCLTDLNLSVQSPYTLKTPSSFLPSPVFPQDHLIKDLNYLYSYATPAHSLFPSEIHPPTLDLERIVVQRQCLGGLFKWTEYITKYFVHPSPTHQHAEILPTYYTPLAISYQSYE